MLRTSTCSTPWTAVAPRPPPAPPRRRATPRPHRRPSGRTSRCGPGSCRPRARGTPTGPGRRTGPARPARRRRGRTRAAEHVVQPHRPAVARSGHGSGDPRLGGRVADRLTHDEVRPAVGARPGPGDQVTGSWRCRASRWPPAASSSPVADRARRPRRAAGGTHASRRPSGLRPGGGRRNTGQPHAPALELALVPQRGAGQGGDRPPRRPARRRRASVGRDPRLVVVLQEPHQPRLVAEVGARGAPRTGAASAVDEPVVEPLVVAEVEALLLQLPLHVPVRLGDEQHGPGCRARTRPMHLRPELRRPAPARPARPRSARTRRLSHQHRHVAADAVALVGDVGQRVAPSPRAAPGEKASSCTTSGHGGKYGSRPRASTWPPTSSHAPGVAPRGRPRVPRTNRSGCSVTHGWSGRDVVGHVVEQQPQPRAGAAAARAAASPLGPPKRGVDDVAAHAVRRADDVARSPGRAARRGTTPAAPASAQRDRAARPGCAPRRPSARRRRRRPGDRVPVGAATSASVSRRPGPARASSSQTAVLTS